MAVTHVRMRHREHGGIALIPERAVQAHTYLGWELAPEPPAAKPAAKKSAKSPVGDQIKEQ